MRWKVQWLLSLSLSRRSPEISKKALKAMVKNAMLNNIADDEIRSSRSKDIEVDELNCYSELRKSHLGLQSIIESG